MTSQLDLPNQRICTDGVMDPWVLTHVLLATYNPLFRKFFPLSRLSRIWITLTQRQDTEKQPGDKGLGLDSRDDPSSSHTYTKIKAL